MIQKDSLGDYTRHWCVRALILNCHWLVSLATCVSLQIGIATTLARQSVNVPVVSQVKVPPAFSCEKVADDSLATNIYRMAVNPRGEVFVSGPGYIRRLVDVDGDGVFDRAVTFADLPKSGAQGLWCDEDFVLAVGDDGVWRFEDSDRNGIADGPPQLLMKIGTAGEHFAHQIKRGPDDWWYLIAGNQTPIEANFSTGSFSPVKFPRAGFLMRISPDFKTKEVVAHGFRNAYGFDFNARDEIFVYDSDDEREVGLPWYRPTRLFQIQLGDDAGWVNDGWKRPGGYFDMSLEIGSAGRGSPTGVVCYHASKFPPQYHQAIFIGDWTFGRILVAHRDQQSKAYQAPGEFVTAISPFAFAVTDLVVDADGNLLVSVGGRQTAGAVYKISYAGASNPQQIESPESLNVLQALARKRGELSQPELQRVIDAMFEGDVQQADGLSQLQRRQLALQILQGRAAQLNQSTELHPKLVQALTDSLREFDPTILKLIYRLGMNLEQEILSQIDQQLLYPVNRHLLSVLTTDNDADQLQTLSGMVGDIRQALLKEVRPDSKELMAISRMITLLLGDFGESDGALALRGYQLDEFSTLPPESISQIGNDISSGIQFSLEQEAAELAIELGRIGALLQIDHEPLQQTILKRLYNDLCPEEKLHWLLCLSQTGFPTDAATLSSIARLLYELNQNANGDRNFEPRLTELAAALIARRPTLATELSTAFSAEDHQLFALRILPEELRSSVTTRLANLISKNPGQATIRQLQVLIESRSLEFQYVFRQTAVAKPDLADLSILALTRLPEERHRDLYRLGILSRNLTVAKNSAIALRKLHSPPNDNDLQAALNTIARLNWSEQHVSVRDQLIMLFDTRLVQQTEYQYKQPGLIQTQAIQKLRQAVPERISGVIAEEFDSQTDWRAKFARVDWGAGDANRGQILFRELKCAQCHQGGQPIGPSLEGVTKRFSRDDIFRILADPSNQISDRYRAKLVLTTDGMLHTGVPIYESIDGVTLQTAEGITLRINQSEIDSIRDSDQSLMPSSLLDELSPEQFADLQAHLETLNTR